MRTTTSTGKPQLRSAMKSAGPVARTFIPLDQDHQRGQVSLGCPETSTNRFTLRMRFRNLHHGWEPRDQKEMIVDSPPRCSAAREHLACRPTLGSCVVWFRHAPLSPCDLATGVEWASLMSDGLRSSSPRPL
jgi:hypothetical protein